MLVDPKMGLIVLYKLILNKFKHFLKENIEMQFQQHTRTIRKRKESVIYGHKRKEEIEFMSKEIDFFF